MSAPKEGLRFVVSETAETKRPESAAFKTAYHIYFVTPFIRVS